MNYNNFNDDAEWMAKCYTVADWNRLHPNPHYLLQEEHMSCHNVEPDEAHCLHLGVSQYTLGSILWMLVYSCNSLRGAPAENIERIWGEIHADYKANRVPTQMSNLKLKSFHNPQKIADEYPRLKAKAAETKDLVAPLCRVWERHMDARDNDHIRIRNMLRKLVELQGILHDHSHLPLLPDDDAHRFRGLIRGFLKDYSLLANSADREQVLLFSVVPKHHWLWHLGERALLINPRKSCCLLDEDYVGHFKLLVAACAHGNAAHNIQFKVAEQYRYGFYFTLKFSV